MISDSLHTKNQIANRFIKNKEEKRVIHQKQEKNVETEIPQRRQEEKRQIIKRQTTPLPIHNSQTGQERKIENHFFQMQSNPNTKVDVPLNPIYMKQNKPVIQRMTSIVKRQTKQLEEPVSIREEFHEIVKLPEIKLDIPVTNITEGDIMILDAIVDRKKANPMTVEIANIVEKNAAKEIQILESKIGRKGASLSIEPVEITVPTQNNDSMIMESNQNRKGKEMNVIKWEPPIVKETRPIFKTIQYDKPKQQLKMLSRLDNSITSLNIINSTDRIEMNQTQHKIKLTDVIDLEKPKDKESTLNENQILLIQTKHKSLQDEIGFRVLCHFLKKEPIFNINKNSKIPQYFIEIIEPNQLSIPAIFDYLQQKKQNIEMDEITEKWSEYVKNNNADPLLQEPELLQKGSITGFHTNLPFYSQDSICLILRGHIRNSFDKPDLYYLIKQLAMQYTELTIYIHTWNKKSSKVSWRSIPEDNTEITEDIIRNYFKDTAQYIRKIYVDDDTQIEIKGKKTGIICKTKQPIIAWKNMWYGIAKITEEVYNDKSTKNSIVVNTRFDVMQNSHTITAKEIHLFIKEQLKAAKYQLNQFYYKNDNYFGIDNLYTGDIETVHKLVMHMYENLDTILAKYPKIFVQEVMVFYENNCILGELPKKEMYKNIQLYMKE